MRRPTLLLAQSQASSRISIAILLQLYCVLFFSSWLRRAWYQASKDDVTVYAALSKAPSAEYVNVSRWYKHIDALLRISFYMYYQYSSKYVYSMSSFFDLRLLSNAFRKRLPLLVLSSTSLSLFYLLQISRRLS
ncbi:elongation factor 1-delta-like [Senna tora]|uniref:Elongation factor 1-delta-like n=1 Tax=Senna tora TaxID=362788 RepID=A0A834XEQ7_9FABA|nr:elongation factor 1-delta-like [Senna tora]